MKYKPQADSIERNIALIRSDLTKLVSPPPRTSVDIAEDKALKAKLGQIIRNQHDLLKQNFQNLEDRTIFIKRL